MGLFGNKRDKDMKAEKSSHYYQQEKGDQCSEYGPPALLGPQGNFPLVPMDNFGQVFPQQQEKFSKYIASNPFQSNMAFPPMFFPPGPAAMNFFSPPPPQPSSYPFIQQQQQQLQVQQQQPQQPMYPQMGVNQFYPFFQQQQQQQAPMATPFSPYQQMNYLDPMLYQQYSSAYGYVPSSF